MKNKTLRIATMLTLALLVPFLLIACGDADEGLTRADVSEIVRTEIANVPAPEPGLTGPQVEQIVREAVGLTSRKLSRNPPARRPSRWQMARRPPCLAGRRPPNTLSTLSRTPSASTSPEGLDATLAYYNTKESIDGQWYIFILDQDDVIIAHAANPDLVGRPASAAIGPNGYPAGEAVVAVADEDGAWFDYTFPNPVTGAAETKHSWIVRYDGLVFGTGWYEGGPRKSDAPAYTQSFVRQALNLYDALGLEATLAYYNTKESVDGQWYLFITDQDDVIIAHAANPDLVGRPASAAIGPNGYPAGEAVVAVADEDGAWFDYTFPNPVTGAAETKHSWIVRYDGLVFGTGWYEGGPRKSDAPAYTKSFVQQALNLYDALGLEATMDYYSSKESVDGQWYVFVIDEDGYTIAHHDDKFVGRDPSLRVDATGYFYGDEMLAATEEGRWVENVLVNPESGENQQKHTWMVRHDGLLFGSGWYER